MSYVTIENSALKVTISSQGAELQSVIDKQGNERLWQGDPAFWTGRAPILFPIAGGLKDDCYILDGQSYPMPKHGIVRKLPWQVDFAEADRAVFSISAQHPGFPFEYTLQAEFSLKDEQLEIRYTVINRDSRAFAYGIGSHEAYATPEGIEEYEIVFDEEERLENSVLEGNLIRPESELWGEHVRALPLKYDYFAVDALVFRSLRSRGVTLRHTQSDRKVHVSYPDHSVLMLWTKPGAGYICIEPWINAPDLTTSDRQILHKPGIVHLQPGCQKTHLHTITFA